MNLLNVNILRINEVSIVHRWHHLKSTGRKRKEAFVRQERSQVLFLLNFQIATVERRLKRHLRVRKGRETPIRVRNLILLSSQGSALSS